MKRWLPSGEEKKGGCVPFLLPLFDNGKVKYFPIRSLFIRSFIRCFNLHFFSFFFGDFFRFYVLKRCAVLRCKIVTRIRFFALFLAFLTFFFLYFPNFLISLDFLRFSFRSYFSPLLHRRLLVLLHQSGYSGAFFHFD